MSNLPYDLTSPWRLMHLIRVVVLNVAIGWGIAWLAAKGVSFIWSDAEPWVFYGVGGMWTLVTLIRVSDMERQADGRA